MQLHEFQAKDLLRRYDIATPLGRIALTLDEAAEAMRQIDSEAVFVKAQILAGDRLAAGGVRAVSTVSDARQATNDLLGKTLVTSQTGPGGYRVKRVLLEPAIDAVQEFYLALRVDAGAGCIVAVAGPHRRSSTEQHLLAASPGVQNLQLDIRGERRQGDILDFWQRVGIAKNAMDQFCNLLDRLLRAFIEIDASLIEINPLILTEAGILVAADVKLTIDENAIFRHPDLASLRDDDEVEQIQLQAQRHQINYVHMDGNIGIIANGAGLGLATLDMVRAAGGAPANFMDIRTTAKSLDIAHGIGLILANASVKVLLLNVYGGGMQSCDTIVDGLGVAARRSGRILPMVLRITGNNEQSARMRLANFNLPTIECADMWQAALRATATALGRE